jgi:hypothetical protein
MAPPLGSLINAFIDSLSSRLFHSRGHQYGQQNNQWRDKATVCPSPGLALGKERRAEDNRGDAPVEQEVNQSTSAPTTLPSAALRARLPSRSTVATAVGCIAIVIRCLLMGIWFELIAAFQCVSLRSAVNGA